MRNMKSVRNTLESSFNSTLSEILQISEAERANMIKDDEGYCLCSVCKERKEGKRVFLGHIGLFKRSCACDMQREQERKEAEKAEKRKDYVKYLKHTGVGDNKYLSYAFKNDDSPTSTASKIARAYVEKWDQMLERKQGLLLHGDRGTGKTFYAGCIANSLIEQRCVRVCMTSTVKLLMKIQAGSFDFDLPQMVTDLKKNKLIIIDDLGAQRKTEFATEKLYYIFDELYKSDIPIIITSNLSPKQLIDTDIDSARIYDRMLEKCQPIELSGESRRVAKMFDERTKLANILGVDIDD